MHGQERGRFDRISAAVADDGTNADIGLYIFQVLLGFNNKGFKMEIISYIDPNNHFLAEQSVALSIQTRKDERVAILFNKSLSESCFLKVQGEWKRLHAYDVPKELVNKTWLQLSALLEVASLRVSQYDDGDHRLSLRFGLNGGMFRQEVDRLKDLEGYQQMIAQVEREFLAVPVMTLNPVTNALVRAGAGAGFGALGVGLGLGATALIALAAGPIGWAVAGAGIGFCLVGAIVLGTCGWLFASYRLEEPNRAKEKLNDIFEKYAQIQVYMDTRDTEAAGRESVRLYQQLQTDGYIKNASDYGFELNDSSFKTLVKHFKIDKKYSVLFTAKFLVLSVLACMPAEFTDGRRRPTLAIITHFERLLTDGSTRGVDEPIIQSVYFILGMLLSAEYSSRAVEYYERILPASELYPLAQRAIASVRTLQGQVSS